MACIKKVTKSLDSIYNRLGGWMTVSELDTITEAKELLKEQEAMNVDSFVQWCIDSHIVGDATVRGIEYWVKKYKEIKEGR